METIDLTIRTWRAFERQVPHNVRALGISNVDERTLRNLYEAVTVKPIVVQNRFYPQTAWDREVRRFCQAKNLVYQSFWTLTANPQLLRSNVIFKVAEVARTTLEAALYLCVMSLGDISVLNGTTNKQTMIEDLASLERWDAWSAQEGNRELAKALIKKFCRFDTRLSGGSLRAEVLERHSAFGKKRRKRGIGALMKDDAVQVGCKAFIKLPRHK